MTLYVLKNNLNQNKIGIAVSKKFSKSSVRRNRVKRLIREVYRLNEEEIILGNSIIVLWKNNVTYDKVNFSDIYKDLVKCLSKASLLKREAFNA